MEDLFGQIECRSKSDSIVMKILRCAMDEAHEKLQFTDGPIEFLHERTIFYELARILVEGGLNIVKDQESDILEGGCNKVVSDLVEIREWLQGRIHDMKLLIVEKDRELVYLHEKMEPEGTKNVARDEEIFKLKNSVDQQMLNIKQKLEEEKKVWIKERRMRRGRVSSPNLSFDFLDKERSGSLVMKEGEVLSNLSRSSINQNVLIKGMSSDIDVLKETVDLAFGRMESGEMIPLEKQWRWSVERDVEMVMMKGFVRQVRGIFDVELKNKVGVLKKDLFYYIDENYMYNGSVGNDVSEKGGSSVRQTTSEPDLDSSYIENVFVDDVGDNRSHHVAKMIKNHESIICKQREQYKWLTREALSAKGKKDKDVCRQERRIQEAIMRFDNFSKRNENVRPKNAVEQRRIPNNEMKMSKTSARVERLEAERDGMCFQISVMEDVYNLLLKSMMKEIDASFLETLLEKDVYKFVVLEALKDVHVDITEHNLQESTPRSWRLNTPRSRRVGGSWSEFDESLILKLDSLLMCLEEEEDLMLKASSMIKEHSVNNSLVILNCEEMEERNAIEWLITDDESTFNLVSEKLERALQQLYTSKELLAELEQSLEVSDEFGIEDETSDQYSNNVLSIIVEFRRKFTNVEHMLHENLEGKCLRLERLKHEVDVVSEALGWMRRRKLLYKKAFISRCHNLKLAENEVDLLGDQVESLLYLLERIYHVLNRNATVFSCYFEVYDMLKLIKIELKNGRSYTPKS